MKSKILMVASVVALLALPSQFAAQDNRGHISQKHHHYKLIDVGTFGGPNAYLSYPLPGEVQINRHGLVAGVADTPS